jgi:hypothetical protein
VVVSTQLWRHSFAVCNTFQACRQPLATGRVVPNVGMLLRLLIIDKPERN